MTCVIMSRSGTKVYGAADGRVLSGFDVYSETEVKLTKTPMGLWGIAGDLVGGQYLLDLVEKNTEVEGVIKAIRGLSKEHEGLEVSLLLGTPDYFLYFDSDGCVAKDDLSEIAAIGSGRDAAMGYAQAFAPEALSLSSAVLAAGKLNVSIGLPILELEYDKEDPEWIRH